MDLHWNSGAKTATATVELLERQNINIKTHGKHQTISGHLKCSENYKRADIQYRNICMASLLDHGDCIILAEYFHAKIEDGMLTVRFIA
ncbi:uncharacterized protein HD556DRAFT_1333787 [Suillus plorans]|uniref:Uncharacterized protein n=1 Tax=Suillus plorans TaxID=116603 RepID=A0A9P7DSD2_9AGAM|nr:uncharacterized protein HD556DRAFT_1333787 [Suillus plorans]KAG1802013.1 hypothetical protein HD556DRAFT_1333787 [Suillus plorans]